MAAALLLLRPHLAVAQVSVLTHHMDNLRTGWNNQETELTTGNVGGGGFGLRQTVAVDEQVNAQPLIVPGVALPGQGTHTVIYVATENNTVYAIDAGTGAVLLSQNLGAPMPSSAIPPSGCDKGGDVIGIDSTPVIDPQAGVLYVITYTQENAAPVYRLHALSITTLADIVPSQVIAATVDLANGKPANFNAASTRQRPALLLANNTIYAGFGSFCDHFQTGTRGWVLGWQGGTLAPLTTDALINRQYKAPRRFFLSSIWMSGAGLAADQAGDIYAVTGNSDNSGSTYDSKINPAESVLRLAPDLSTLLDFFTPGGPTYGEPELDMHDLDFGAGGIMLLPTQKNGAVPNLAVAAGKVGTMYLLNQASLGGYAPNGPDNVVGEFQIGSCFCAASYFVGADGVARVVSSGGHHMIVWRLRTSPDTRLAEESRSGTVPTGPDIGFFTSVSSNGTQAGSAIIWAVARPNRSGSLNLTLLAYNAANSETLFSGTAGVWSTGGANANTVPVVANGHVYVGGYKSLSIFGFDTAAPSAARK